MQQSETNKQSPEISIILPSYLGDYQGAAINREYKLRRAIESVLFQTGNINYELIIASDACYKTNAIVEFEYKKYDHIKLVKLTEKQPLFSGNVRNAALQAATGTNICYLDSDDILEPFHLKSIIENHGDNDLVYFDDILLFGKDASGKCVKQIRESAFEKGKIGTSSIAHKRVFASGYQPSWRNCDGYGHDYRFVQHLIIHADTKKKIEGAGYLVCHLPEVLDY